MGHVRQQPVNRQSRRRPGRHGGNLARRRLPARWLPTHWLPARWLPIHWLAAHWLAARRLATAAVLMAAAALLIPASPAAARPAPARAAARDPGAQVPVLAWRLCPGRSGAQGFECATARVPLDYTNPAGRTIQIAVIRHRATGPGARLGSLFYNPGGPGDQGTVYLPADYRSFPAPVRQRFDIVSFNPRGGSPGNRVQCFPTAADEARFLGRMAAGFPVGSAQQRQWIRANAVFTRLCERRNAGLLRHVSTADVARDMDLLRQAVGDPMLSYLGVSYGTYLGATYASLFPGRVGAMVLDGNVPPLAFTRPQQVHGIQLTTSLRIGTALGAHATFGQFLTLCGQVSTRRCAFSAGSPAATHAKFTELVRRLWRHPVTAAIPGADRATITYAGLFGFLLPELYHIKDWPPAATTLQAIWTAGHAAARRSPAQSAAAPYPHRDHQLAVICAGSPNPRQPAAYRAAAVSAFTRSGGFGPLTAWSDEACATWPAVDAHGYNGPWNKATAHPLLVIGNTYDPATPYQNAVAMTRELARTRLLTLAGYGHGALNNPSACISRYEADYFLTGALPPAGTVCHQDKQPFP